MPLARYHTRIFAAWRAVASQLDSATWPAHPIGGSRPVVTLVDSIPDQQREVVAVVPVVDDNEIEWVQLGAASREERFGLNIVIRTEVPGVKGYDTTANDVVTRLEDLAEVVQDEFYNTTTGAFSPPVFDGVQALGGIDRVRPVVAADSEGWFGFCELRLLIASRI